MQRNNNMVATGFFAIAICISSFIDAQGLPPVAYTASNGSTTPQTSGGKPAPNNIGWTDPALNHNNLLMNQGVYQLVGPYKVKGSQFLFGQKHKGNLFSTLEKAWNISISYNTYNQEVEFYSTANPDQSLVKEPGTLDSFTILADILSDISTDLKFIYGNKLGSNEKYYYQEVLPGQRFSLYKRYRSDFIIPDNNYAQSDVRQFEIQFEYYYTDTKGKGVKKIKPNMSAVVKEFKDIKDLSGELVNTDFDINKEDALKKAFELLNNTIK